MICSLNHLSIDSFVFFDESMNSEFNLQVQQANELSLRRSEMFIATATLRNLAPSGAKPGSGTFAGGSQERLRTYGALE